MKPKHVERLNADRDTQGKFTDGNRTGITSSDHGRALQLLSAKQRLRNRKVQTRGKPPLK